VISVLKDVKVIYAKSRSELAKNHRTASIDQRFFNSREKGD
jgi:hypothetical protein